MRRRGAPAVAASTCLARAAHVQPAIPDDNRRAFRITRNGSAIGTHVLTFARLDNGFDIRIAVAIAVGFGPITLFRYALRGLEQWRNGTAIHLDATANMALTRCALTATTRPLD